MADIFISYSQVDRERVQPIVEALSTLGFSVWWDTDGVSGVDVDEMVDEQMAVSKCVVVVWSHNSIKSDWVRGEADEARINGKLIPLRIDDVSAPRRFRGLNTARLEDWDGDSQTHSFQQLAQGIQRQLDSVHNSNTTIPAEDQQNTYNTIQASAPRTKKTRSANNTSMMVGGIVLLTIMLILTFSSYQNRQKNADIALAIETKLETREDIVFNFFTEFHPDLVRVSQLIATEEVAKATDLIFQKFEEKRSQMEVRILDRNLKLFEGRVVDLDMPPYKEFNENIKTAEKLDNNVFDSCILDLQDMVRDLETEKLLNQYAYEGSKTTSPSTLAGNELRNLLAECQCHLMRSYEANGILKNDEGC